MVEFQNASFQYDDTDGDGISDINLHIKKGEFVLLAGRSGCGKTTITRCINGLIPHFYQGNLRGSILLKGEEVKKLRLNEISKTVGSVFQDPRSQFFTTDTVSEVAFACENAAILKEDLIERVDRSIRELGIWHLRGKSLFELSSGERQRVAIASVYALSPEVYVFDEPSANLDGDATRELAGTLLFLKKQGATVIIAEHRLYYLRDLIDSVVYLERGKITKVYSRKEFLNLGNGDLESMGLRCLYQEHLVPSGRSQEKSAEPLLRVEGIGFRYKKTDPVLSNISFNAYAGDIIGMIGENGAGKSTLAELLCGLLKEKSGAVILDGRRRAPNRRIPKSYFIMQDSEYQLFSESVKEELLLGMADLPAASERAESVLAMLDLTQYKERHPASLSGGQKQRVVIAAAYMRNIRTVIFDEPTSGLDGENMKRVSRLIRKMSEKGMAVFVITHDYELLLSVCQRVLHVKNGKIADDFLLTDETLFKVKKSFGVAGD